MKRSPAKIREEIVRLQDQLKQAESRDAERIGRIALKAGLGDWDVSEDDLQTAFEEMAKTFRADGAVPSRRERGNGGSPLSDPSLAPHAAKGNLGEA
jgi:hypothetical protein